MGSQTLAMPLQAQILDALHRGQTVLTASQRAARTLRRAFDERQKAAGCTLWTPPAIFAFETWLGTLWHALLLEGAESRLLLNSVQEHAVWRAIVAADPEVSELSSVDALADTAADAFRQLHRHSGRARLRDSATSTDTRAFERWATQFDRICARNQWLSAAQLPVVLAAALAQGQLPLPATGLLLVDFDAHPPAHEALLEDVRRCGYAVDALQVSAPGASAGLFTAADDAAELRAVAQWASDHLARRPDASIAVIVPQLANRRPQLERVFAEVFSDREVFEFSLGRPLSETSPVVSALDLLRWPAEPLPLESISALLLCPSLLPPDELEAAAEFDAFELRRADLLRPLLSLDALCDLLAASRRRARRLPGLIARLHALRRAAREEGLIAGSGSEPPARSHAAWADSFRALLSACGWTSSGSTSIEIQIRRSWESVLDSLCTLDFDGTQVRWHAALRAVSRIPGETIFAAESRNAPIQIMGPMEPGGTPFDALWFISADDLSWPSPHAVNPLIPWNLQRELKIPAATPAVAGAAAEALTKRLADGASEVIFSFAERSEDGERRASPLLRPLDLPPLAGLAARAPGAPMPAIRFADREPLPPLPDQITPGGARILELQAACSFRAFAEIRLRSTAPEAREAGLDARERGIHVHRILQEFWDKLGDQAALRALPQPDREALLNQCIEGALARAVNRARTPWDEAYLNVQRRRLRALLHPWLELELTRPPFRVLAQEETLNDVQFGPLRLKLRADRIDHTAGGRLILDYKTGSASPAQWLTERPDAPQLPLYAVLAAQEEEVGGVAFALLRAGDDLDLTGFAGSSQVLKQSSTAMKLPLPDQLEEWTHVLTALAEAFAYADPITDPKLYPKTCERCGQRILCRLDPEMLVNADEEPAEETYRYGGTSQ